MKRNIKLFLIICCIFIASLFYIKTMVLSSKIINGNPETQKLYDEFLQGENKAIFKENVVSIHDIIYEYSVESDDLHYAYFDMNGDSIPELHLKSPIFYLILTSTNEELTLWHEASPYSSPLNNGSILYERSDGAPSHISYKYSVFDFYGNVVLENVFEKYNPNPAGIYDENSDCFFEEVEVSKNDWDVLTKKYLEVGTELIEWNEYVDNIKH